jgi:hypothetical protein
MIVLNEQLKLLGYDPTIKLVDGCYPSSSKDTSFSIIKGSFDIMDPMYLDKDAHNVVVEFCNLMDENWNGWGQNSDNGLAFYNKYKDYKFAYLACGCMWKRGFPSDAVIEIVSKDYQTPRECWSVNAYLDCIQMVEEIKEDGMEEALQSFLKGVYEVMGTLKYRGRPGDWSLEEPIRDLLQMVVIPVEYAGNIERFISGDIRYNRLSLDTRMYINTLVYGGTYGY